MPDVREKLITIIQDSVGGCSRYWASVIAEGLIANGVTIQRWIPVTERLPDDNIASSKYLCYWRGHTAICKYWRMYRTFEFNGREANVTHWMPLPEPPKANDDGEVNGDV